MTTLFLRTSNGHDTEKPYANNDREKLPRRFGQGEECVSSFLTLFIGYRDERTPGMKRCDIPFRQSYARDDPNDMCTCGEGQQSSMQGYCRTARLQDIVWLSRNCCIPEALDLIEDAHKVQIQRDSEILLCWNSAFMPGSDTWRKVQPAVGMGWQEETFSQH